ncbi:MAG: glycosyl hydrolase 108 family protein [Paludibacter sp.]
MAKLNIAFQRMLTHEGGYVNDPNDQGGETYKGISRANHRNWAGWTCIDKYKGKTDFPSILDKDVKLQNEIEEFYHIHFWSPLNADCITNQTNADSIFDFAVNAGLITSIQLAQTIIGTKADGIIGVQTLAKLNTVDSKHFQAAFTVGKIAYYVYIVKRSPANKKYFYGWVIRALKYNE